MTYVEGLQTALAAEHAAVYVYGALGAQTSQSAQPTLYAAVSDAYAVHRARRDRLVALVTEERADPVAADPAYALPADLGSPELVTGRALELERGCATTYAYLVASSPSEPRAWAVRCLTDCAVRELSFGGTPEVLPGS